MTLRGDSLPLIDRLYRLAVKRARPFRILAGVLSDIALAILSRVRRFKISPDRSLADWHMLLGDYEKGTLRVIQSVIRPGMVAVDVGAHIGFFTRVLSRLVGEEGRVYALEAHPVTSEILRQNCRSLGNVRLLEVGASNRSGEASLYDSGGSSGSNSLRESRAFYRGRSTVKVETLDNLLGRETRLDFVKIDVEGSELEVLEGMKDILDRSPDIHLVVEFFPSFWEQTLGSPTVLLDRLEALGFRLFVIRDTGALSAVSELDDRQAFARSVTKYVNLLAVRPKGEHLSGV